MMSQLNNLYSMIAYIQNSDPIICLLSDPHQTIEFYYYSLHRYIVDMINLELQKCGSDIIRAYLL